MNIYEIIFEVDDYQSLLALDEEAHFTNLMDLDGKPRKDLWPASMSAEIDNLDGITPDIFSIEAGNMLLTEKSEKVIKEYLSPNYELLPVFFSGGRGVILNPLGSVDCLDDKKTIWCCDEASGKKLFIDELCFDKNKLPDDLIFRVKGDYFRLFCVDREDGSDNFKSIVENNLLTGLSFELLA